MCPVTASNAMEPLPLVDRGTAPIDIDSEYGVRFQAPLGD
jgi:hypothetical protein